MFRLIKRMRKALRLFRYKMLLSFFAFIRVFIIWLFVYFYINYRQSNLDRFTYHLINLQNQYEESNRNIQEFVINGHQDSAVYLGNRGKDIEDFDSNVHVILADLDQIKQEAGKNFVLISDSLEVIGKLQQQLIDTVGVLRAYYISRGFKDYGAEGKMDFYARFLEDSTPILKTDILMLRRSEKDFMLLGDGKYVTNFNTLINAELPKFPKTSVTYAALLGYRQAFNDYAAYSQRLGINTGEGTYGSLHAIIHRLDGSYRRVNTKVAAEITRLNRIFKIVLIATFILVVIVSVFLSLVLSSRLTKDIRKLNKYMAAFVRSGFREDPSALEPVSSKIAEIQGLIENFDYLKTTLLQTLADLGTAISEEKQLTESLQASKARLNNQLILTAHQQSELIESRLMFTALLQHTTAAVIFLNSFMEIIFHNAIANSLLQGEGQDIMQGNYLTDCIPDTISPIIADHFKIALSGSETSFSHTLVRNEQVTRVHIGLFPIRDDEKNVFAVLLWGIEEQ